MRVLILFETSGNIKKEFLIRGHDAWSFDMLPSKIAKNHICGFWSEDIEILKERWDLMISHPDCTHLAICGARHFKNKVELQKKAIETFLEITELSCSRLAIENPVGIMSTIYKKPSQYIQPWMFGHTETKKTCLWLKNLPLLEEQNNVFEEMMRLPKRERNRIHYMSPSDDRGNLRSITYPGIARAMAEQWG